MNSTTTISFSANSFNLFCAVGVYEYLYIRTNEWLKLLGICKQGITSNIPDREQPYITCEPIAGEFVLVFAILKETFLDLDLDTKIQNEFIKLNAKNLDSKFTGGREFFKEDIIELIEPFLKKLKIQYIVLTANDINNMKKKHRMKKTLNKELVELVEQKKNPLLIHALKSKRTNKTNCFLHTKKRPNYYY